MATFSNSYCMLKLLIKGIFRHCKKKKKSPINQRNTKYLSLISSQRLCSKEHSPVLCFTGLLWGRAQVHVGRRRRRFGGRVQELITVKVLKMLQQKASPCFGCPVRMSPEPEDDVYRCLLKDERVEGKATKQGLHLETVQVAKPVCGILAQKL